MPQFIYRALAADGAVNEGALEAPARQEALQLLERQGVRLIDLREREEAGKPAAGRFRLNWNAARKVSFAAMENFTYQLSSLLTAGVPLSRALRITSREASSPAAAAKWKEIHDRVIDGMSLADAMAKSPETFPRVYVAMVRSGEAGGFLDLALSQIAEFQRRERDLKSRAASALAYPAVLIVLAAGVLTFLMTYFIPRFKDIFSDFGAALPLLTRWIMAASQAMTRYGPFGAVALVAALWALRAWLRSDQGRRTWERWILALPLIGPQVARFAMARFLRMLGALAGAGVPLINALRVARASLGNQTLSDAVDHSIEDVQRGSGLAASLASCPRLFPGSVLEMISVAEETARLDTELTRLAENAERDLDRQLRMAVALLEPALLLVMAAIVAVIVIGMLLPIFTLQEYVQ